MTEVLIKSGGRERRAGERHSALNLSASQSLSSFSDGRPRCGDAAAKASYCNEEKCINLARPRAQIERRVGEGALSESFFLIKDSIEEDCWVLSLASVCRISSIPPRSPPQARVGEEEERRRRVGGASLCLLFHLISRVHTGVRSCPPDAAFNAIPLASKRQCESPPPFPQGLSKGERKHMITC